MRERRRLAEQICKAIDWQCKKGTPVRHAVRDFARRWQGRSYLVAPDRKLHFSEGSLLGLFYGWRRAGESADVFTLKYTARLAPVTVAQARRLLKACAASRVTSLREAARLAGLRQSVAGRIFGRLARRLVRQVEMTFKRRRQASLAVEAAVEKLREEMYRQLAAEQRQSQSLNRAADAFGLKGPPTRAGCKRYAKGRRIKRLGDSFIGRRAGGQVDSTFQRTEGVIQGTGAIFKPVLQGVAK